MSTSGSRRSDRTATSSRPTCQRQPSSLARSAAPNADSRAPASRGRHQTGRTCLACRWNLAPGLDDAVAWHRATTQVIGQMGTNRYFAGALHGSGGRAFSEADQYLGWCTAVEGFHKPGCTAGAELGRAGVERNEFLHVPARGGLARGKAERYNGEDGRQDHSVSHGRHPPSRVNPARGRYTLRFPGPAPYDSSSTRSSFGCADGDGRTLGVDEPCPLVHPGHEQLHHPLHGLGSGVDLEVRDPPPRIVDVDLWWRTSGWFAAMWPIQSVSSAPRPAHRPACRCAPSGAARTSAPPHQPREAACV
jgi:hypothetical protein